MEFYDDDEFLISHSISGNDYIIGQDTIYVEINVDFPDDGSNDNFDIFEVIIDNVFVCTANDKVDLSQDLNQQNGNGGCLSSNIDSDGPYNIITNGVENSEYLADIIASSSESNVARFSFLTFDIGRTKMYVHTQLTLVLQNGGRRRLQLLPADIDNYNGNAFNQIRHFLHSAPVASKDVLATEVADDEKASDSSCSIHVMLPIIFQILYSLYC